MGVSKREVAGWLEELAPRRYAEEWDNVGLQVGSLEGQTESILVGLTPDEDLIVAAARAGARMVVTHHPLIFRALKSIETARAGVGRCISTSLLCDVTVFSCHTNLDVASGGISDALAGALGLGGPLKGAPLKATYEGAALKAHPAEAGIGLGRAVVLVERMTLQELAEVVKERLGCPSVRAIGDLRSPIRIIGVCGGSGAETIRACSGRVDALITGDIKYHEALLAIEMGLCLIDAGHHATEMPGVRALAQWLDCRARAAGVGVAITAHEGSLDPFQLV